MGLCGTRAKETEVKADQKWDYINLSDFRSSGCGAPLSYGILYISLLISITVYVVDTFTAINLLLFDRWTGSVKPIALGITKWIFAGCIILSFINLAFEWTRAVRVMKRGGVAESYLDPLAVRVQSIRVGKTGRGWRRFLVFAELTKSKKGVEYVALFSYFSFKAWLRIIVCEGPRKVINALTLWGVLQANLIPDGQNAAPKGQSPFLQFWKNIGILAQHSRIEALILSSMTFTLTIWVVAALNLIIACILYILFLWHYIPSTDGGLAGYLKRKIDGRVNKVVGVKVNKALEKEEEQRRKQEERFKKSGGLLSGIKREPTLPVLTDEADTIPSLSRQTTQSTLPPYTSRPPTRNGSDAPDYDRQPAVPDIPLGVFNEKRLPPPSRSVTQSSGDSNLSYSSNAPLTRNAGDMGSDMQGPRQSPQPGNGYPRPGFGNGPSRTGTPGPPRMGTPGPSRTGTPGPPRTGTPGGPDGPARSMTPISRSQTWEGRSTPGPEGQGRHTPGPGAYGPNGRRTPGPTPPPQDPRSRRPPGPYPGNGRQTPGPAPDSAGRNIRYGRGAPGPGFGVDQQEIGVARTPFEGGGRPGYNMNSRAASYDVPHASTTDAFPSSRPRYPYPPQRSGTAPLPSDDRYDSILDAYGGSDAGEPQRPPRRGPPRSATADPTTRWGGQTRSPPPMSPPGGYEFNAI